MRDIVGILVERGRLRQSDLDRAYEAHRLTAAPVTVILREMGLLSHGDEAEAVAALHDVPLLRRQDLPEAPVLPGVLGLRFMQESRVMPVAVRPNGLVLAMADPGDTYAVQAVRLAAGMAVLPHAVAADDLLGAIERLHGGARSAIERIVDDIGAELEEAAEEDIERIRDIAREAPVIRLVDQIVSEAVGMRASDIHIEPFRSELKVRFRVDGVLREIRSPPARLAKAIVSRIKILGRLNIAERRLPQDGRARHVVGGRGYDLRISTVATAYGESVVIRILEQDAQEVELGRLGLSAPAEATLRRHLAAPHGLILVTGPTGSGKTTTLAAALHLLNDPARKVLTVEDPIEYQIPGVNQIAVRPWIGLTFAKVLRSIVRHDPDVIMVGEMRDQETASIAIHAALTGHLVLSTLHTNSAAGAIPRLLDMGVDGYLLGSTARAVVGQRLVRTLCRACREPRAATPETEAWARAAGHHGPVRLWQAVGCHACGGSGFAGRVGIFECLEVTDAIRGAVRQTASTAELQALARAQGMATMFEDGLAKCLAGVTTLEEVRRVTEEG